MWAFIILDNLVLRCRGKIIDSVASNWGGRWRVFAKPDLALERVRLGPVMIGNGTQI